MLSSDRTFVTLCRVRVGPSKPQRRSHEKSSCLAPLLVHRRLSQHFPVRLLPTSTVFAVQMVILKAIKHKYICAHTHRAKINKEMEDELWGSYRTVSSFLHRVYQCKRTNTLLNRISWACLPLLILCPMCPVSSISGRLQTAISPCVCVCVPMYVCQLQMNQTPSFPLTHPFTFSSCAWLRSQVLLTHLDEIKHSCDSHRRPIHFFFSLMIWFASLLFKVFSHWSCVPRWLF